MAGTARSCSSGSPLLDKFGAGLDEKVRSSTEELLTKAAKQFDPSDPTSPIAKHAADLTPGK